MVLDGPNPRCMEEQDVFQKEIMELIGQVDTIEFTDKKILVGDWTPLTINKNFQLLLEDPDVDIVIAMGTIASNIAIQQKTFSKPIIAPFVLDHALQNATFDKGTSGVHNLSYLDVPNNIERDILFLKV